MSFRLTFNKPTIAHYFGHGENACSVRVKIENGSAFFMPITGPAPTTRDILPITLRVRGGGESFVEGSRAAELKNALTNDVSNYFTFQRQPNGWLMAKPWTGAQAPNRAIPHVRGWMPSVEAGAVSKPVSIDHDAFESMVAFLREARKLLVVYDGKERRAGRPPKEIAQARETIALFEAVVKEIGVTNFDSRVQRAQELLHQALRSRDPRSLGYVKSLSSKRERPMTRSTKRLEENVSQQ